jgi:hypothetical protein
METALFTRNSQTLRALGVFGPSTGIFLCNLAAFCEIPDFSGSLGFSTRKFLIPRGNPDFHAEFTNDP